MATRNGLELTKACLESIFRYTDDSDGEFELIFVDNGSSDGTQEYLQGIPNSKLIVNSENKGFAAANNQGLLAASGDYLLLLNNDVIVTENWLSGLLARLLADKTLAAVGPRACNVAPIQNVNPAYGNLEEMQLFAKEWRRTHLGTGFYSHRLIGFCLLFHRKLLDEIGGLDEQFYPGGYEDDDFCLRARIRGYRLWVADDVYIHHHGHGSFQANNLEYNNSALVNAERFRKKWNPGISAFELQTFGYNPSEIVAREPQFLPDRHFVSRKPQT